MKGIFDFNNPVMSFLSKLADLMILNVLTIICCVPIVTVGASLSSMYYVLLRLRNEETSFVTKDFFHAFRQNLRQGRICVAKTVKWNPSVMNDTKFGVEDESYNF